MYYDGEIMVDIDCSTFDGELMDDNCHSLCTCKHCNAFKIFDGLNFDYQLETVKIPPHQNFALHVIELLIQY